jgi:hypothetical protein
MISADTFGSMIGAVAKDDERGALPTTDAEVSPAASISGQRRQHQSAEAGACVLEAGSSPRPSRPLRSSSISLYPWSPNVERVD